MKLTDTFLFFGAIGFMFVALHQHMTKDFISSYWLYMISIGMLLGYKMRKDKAKKNNS